VLLDHKADDFTRAILSRRSIIPVYAANITVYSAFFSTTPAVLTNIAIPILHSTDISSRYSVVRDIRSCISISFFAYTVLAVLSATPFLTQAICE
jgi:hypothetical protein